MITTSLIHKKGGAGKTMFLINCAAKAAQDKNNKVVILDLSDQPHAREWVKLRNKNTELAKIDYLEGRCEDAKNIIDDYSSDYTHMFIETTGAYTEEVDISIKNSDIVIVLCDSSSGSALDTQYINNEVLIKKFKNKKAFLVPNGINNQRFSCKNIMEDFDNESAYYSNMTRVKGFLNRIHDFEKSFSSRTNPKTSTLGRGVVEAWPKSKPARQITNIYNQIFNVTK